VNGHRPHSLIRQGRRRLTNPNLINEGFKATLTQVMLDTIQFKTFCLLCKKVKIKIYKTIIFPVVLCGYETWSLTLKKERSVFEKRVLRRIFGPKRYEMIGG
jgi:hypothetical protein